MIRCNLSTLMGSDKLRISDVVRETGLNRGTNIALLCTKSKQTQIKQGVHP